jgi:hypothetical protein
MKDTTAAVLRLTPHIVVCYTTGDSHTSYCCNAATDSAYCCMYVMLHFTCTPGVRRLLHSSWAINTVQAALRGVKLDGESTVFIGKEAAALHHIH